MKIFVSGRIDDISNVRKIQNELIAAGHNLTHDWTKTDTMLGGRYDKLKNKRESAHRAKLDIDGVVESDVYILCSSNKTAGKGMYAELGAALALNAIKNKPDIYILGPLNHLTVFYLHPAVKHRENVKDILHELG